MGNTARGLLTAAIACVVATPVAVWWLVGDLSAPVPAGAPLDYTLRPPALPAWAEWVIGIVAVLVTGVSLVLLVRASRRSRFDPRWWAALVPALTAGALAGLGWRVVTAGTIGPNIGAGLALMLGVPFVALLLLWAIGWSAHLLRSRRAIR
ncbi:hypothetical protein ABZ897_26790 [Nonomuraea sp. NPDC046802]|uniref:hypothetical protein n=1 Tax=Nonomuraea sp. NPDC046802 TaxID=3154919 RepID=UPI0033C107E5